MKKFRVWDKITKSYGGGDLWHLASSGTLYYGNAQWPEGIVEWCTDLTDKNGKEIYGGDHCRVTRLCILCYGEITFENGCFWFKDDGPSGLLRLCDIKINGFEIEVIGNIHDNPELLEVEI